LITTILSPCNPHDTTSLTTLLVLFLVGVESLWRLDTQGRFDARERGDAEKDDRDEHEKGKK
jgi:hypothetical protein